MNFNITRRQFLQYCAASAAALGLSQTDLLKLEKALATPQGADTTLAPSVIYLSAQACSGCPTSLLNRVVSTGGKYYDADMLNALYGTSLPAPTTLDVAANDPANHDSPWVNPLAVVNDVTDLVVGDAVRALVPGLTRSLLWADDAVAAVGLGLLPTDTLLGAYLGPFPRGYATIEWNTTIMAAAGDIPAKHMREIRNGAGVLGAFLLIVDGSIPKDSADKGNFCWVFDNNDGSGGKVVKGSDTWTNGATPLTIPFEAPITAGQALQWLAGAPGCLGIVAQGTCAAFGGIPSGKGNYTGAKSVEDYLAGLGITTPVINVPGCPPHPDWTVYPIAYILSHTTTGGGLNLALPTLDRFGRPQAVFSGSTGDQYQPFCMDCPNKDSQGTPQAAQELGDAGCLGAKGCKGPYTFGDCPIRGKNTSDDGLSMNWCVGASGQNSTGTGIQVDHVGECRHPCQGCIQPDFPDWKSLVGSGGATSGKFKGFYNE